MKAFRLTYVARKQRRVATFIFCIFEGAEVSPTAVEAPSGFSRGWLAPMCEFEIDGMETDGSVRHKAVRARNPGCLGSGRAFRTRIADFS